MRQQVTKRFTDHCRVERRTQTGETATNEPIYDDQVVVDGEPCQYLPSGTTFTREDAGEHVQRPARIRVRASVDVQEGDQILVDGVTGEFEVRSVEPMRGSRTGRELALLCELERIA